MILQYKNTSQACLPSPIAIAAGSATDATHQTYIDMASYAACSLQVEWTAGGAGGTLVLKVYGCIVDDTTDYDSAQYQDITNDVFGAASITDDSIALDGGNMLGNVKWIRIDATIANKDASTALYVYARQKRFG